MARESNVAYIAVGLRAVVFIFRWHSCWFTLSRLASDVGLGLWVIDSFNMVGVESEIVKL